MRCYVGMSWGGMVGMVLFWVVLIGDRVGGEQVAAWASGADERFRFACRCAAAPETGLRPSSSAPDLDSDLDPPGGMDILETIAGHGARLGRPLPHPRGSRATPAHSTNTEDMTTACALIFDSAMEAQVRHVGQPQLTASLNSARKRSIGDRWAWNRKSADSDITPIVAATLALWGLNSTKVMRRTGERRKGVVWSW